MSEIVFGNTFALPAADAVEIVGYERLPKEKRVIITVVVKADGRVLGERQALHIARGPEDPENPGQYNDVVDRLGQDTQSATIGGLVDVKRRKVIVNAWSDLVTAMQAAGEEEAKLLQYMIDKDMVPAALNPSVA